MNEKEIAYVEAVIDELSESLNKCYHNILDEKEFETPDFEKIITKRNLSEEQLEFASDVFSQPFAELYEVDSGENEELTKKYEWLSEEKRKKLISVLDALVTACVSGYTELQPEFQELKEKMRKIAENEKKEAHQKKQ